MLPILNKTEKNFTTRDNLGLTGATNSMQAELCPVVTTVTPRAFYWPFLVWNYYNYHKYSGVSNKDATQFNVEYVKKNDYFFVLANLLSEQPDQYNLVGKDNVAGDIFANRSRVFSFNKDYFKARFGGMQYYNGGCETLGFITSEDNSGNRYSFPLITEALGKPLALAFENAFCNTEYFKSYRLSDSPIPEKVLIELGNTINLSMNHLHDCKNLLKQALFNPDQLIKGQNKSRLIQSSDYVRFIHDNLNQDPSTREMRYYLYQVCSVRGGNFAVQDELREVSCLWEAVDGRQYLTLSLELIWKALLSSLSIPMNMQRWINKALKEAVFTRTNTNSKLQAQAQKWNLSGEDIEAMIRDGYRNQNNIEDIIDKSLVIMFSLYNRFSSRDDITNGFLRYGNEVSIGSLISYIDRNPDQPVLDFLLYVIEEWILKRHLSVAQEKMFAGRDAYYFNVEDGLCFKRYDAAPDFTGIRLLSLMQVMKDLDML